MRDETISGPRIALLHPAVRDLYRAFIESAETELNITLRSMQTYRTFAQQAAIYAQGRTAPGPIVTNAAPGTSYHNYGLADDLCHLLDDGQVDWHFDMSLLLPMAPAGMEWGGNFFTFKDLPHWEFSFGYAISDLLAKYNAGNFIPGTEYVNLS